MFHPFGFSLAQQVLIVAGTIFQFSAYYLFSRECAHARMAEEAQRERAQAEAEAAQREKAALELVKRPVFPKVVKYRRRIEGVMEHVPDDVRPAELVRTAKVRFKHSLEAYHGETQAMPAIRREGDSTGE